jgi:carboxylesterase type B
MILYGQSAGAQEVGMYTYANPTDPIVAGFIIASSGPAVTNPANSSNFNKVAQMAGCANLTAAAELTCMQGVNALVLQQKVDEANTDPFRGLFRPIIDNITAFANITDRLDKGLVAKQVSVAPSWPTPLGDDLLLLWVI